MSIFQRVSTTHKSWLLNCDLRSVRTSITVIKRLPRMRHFCLRKRVFWCFLLRWKKPSEWFLCRMVSQINIHISHILYVQYLSICLSVDLSIDWSMYACILCLHPLPASSACIPCLLPPPIHPSHRYIEAIQCTQTQRVKTLQIPQLHNFLPRIPEVYSPGNPPGVHHLWLLHRSNTDPAASDAPSLAWTPGDLVLGVFWMVRIRWSMAKHGNGSIPINTIFRGMNIHLPAILMWTEGVQGFDTHPHSTEIGCVYTIVYSYYM